MGSASYQATSFLGGEISKFAQGRYDRPDYRTCLSVCFNMHPIESGACVRRPGSQFIGTTRGGALGRVAKFDFEAAAAYMLEFTDGFLRYRTGTRWATTNDGQTVAAISTANPAVVQTTFASGWATGNAVTFGNLGTSAPLLQNRQFSITTVDSTHFSLTDAITGATIDGSTLGTIPAGATVSRIQESVSPYVGGSWATVRIVQAETTAFTLQATVPPQAITVTTLPAAGVDAQFAITPCVFNDGPYLDPFINGVQITPGGTSGVVTLTLGFPLYSATTAYAKGAFVVDATPVNYISLIDQNVGNTPASSPSAWQPTAAGAAINNGQGWLGTDVGRLFRIFSEPPLWDIATTYTFSSGSPQVVSYNPSGLPGGATYWQLLATVTGKAPGSDLTHWELVTAAGLNPTTGLTSSAAAVWSWGKIVSLTTQISQTVSGVANIGNMLSQGGLAAAFDGVTVQKFSASAARASNTGNYVGRHYAGGAQAIGSVAIYPPSDTGFSPAGVAIGSGNPIITVNVRAKATLPANSTDGTLLATKTFGNQNAAISLVSNDQVTTWNYLWVEIIVTNSGAFIGAAVAEFQQFSPSGTGTGAAVNVEILGPALLYTTPATTWRLGVYSNTTGFPTCGCYHEGRLWLGGVVANRFDASVSDGIVGGTVNFAPTDQYGTVTAASGISEVLNSDGVNPILWMIPDQQGIIMGTLACEFLVSPPTPGGMAPTNIAGRRVTTIGCANVEPRRTDHTIAFVQRYGRKLMEYFADVYSGKFTAPNLAQWAMHLTVGGIAEIAYQQAVTPIIWGRNGNGSLWGITYKRDTLSTSSGPTYAGWHRHALGSGRSVISIAVGPSTDGTLDTLYMVTTDGTTCHVEVITDLIEEGATLSDAAYLDDAVAPTSTISSNAPITGAPYGGLTLNGLWHLNGKTVTAWLSGLDCGDYTVSNGSIVVPYGDGVSAGTGSGLFTAAGFIANPTALVGFTFTSQGQLVRPNSPAESGARNGPALGKKRRTQEYAVQLEGTGYAGTAGTGSISFGTTFTNPTGGSLSPLDPARFKDDGDTPYLPNQHFTGVHWGKLQDTYSYDSMVCWQITRPYPANVIAVEAFLQSQDK